MSELIFFLFWHFPPTFDLLKLTCLVTLFDRKFQVFKNSPNWPFLAFFNILLSTQNVNVARFARNVEWDFFYDFQTQCSMACQFLGKKSLLFIFCIGKMSMMIHIVLKMEFPCIWRHRKKVEHLINFQVHIWSHSSSCNIWANLKLETLVGVGEAGTPTRQLSVLDFLSSVRYAMPLPGPNSKCAQFKANGHETLNF